MLFRSEAAAATVGIDLARTKVLAFAISALYAGIAGSVSVLVHSTASADKVETFQSSIEFRSVPFGASPVSVPAARKPTWARRVWNVSERASPG